MQRWAAAAAIVLSSGCFAEPALIGESSTDGGSTSSGTSTSTSTTGMTSDAGGPAGCGDGVVDAAAGEDCEAGVALPSCQDLQFDGGELGCDANCRFDLSQCISQGCGDGVIEAPEECEPSVSLPQTECSAIDSAYVAGTLSCADNCTYDLSDCGVLECDCLPVPQGWNGPVWVADGNEPMECPEELGRSLVAFADLEVFAGSCDCDCPGAINFGSCADLAGRHFTAPGCSAPLDDTPYPLDAFMLGECLSAISDVSGDTVEQVVQQPGGAAVPTCGQAVPDNDLPPPVWGQAVTACEADNLGGCGASQACVAPLDEPFGQLCIYQEGTSICPPAYPNSGTFFLDVLDGRTCSECQMCQPSVGASCTYTLEGYMAGGCVGPSMVWDLSMTGPLCIDGNNAYTGSFEFDQVITGTCDYNQAPPMLSGTVEPADPVTVCCQ